MVPREERWPSLFQHGLGGSLGPVQEQRTGLIAIPASMRSDLTGSGSGRSLCSEAQGVLGRGASQTRKISATATQTSREQKNSQTQQLSCETWGWGKVGVSMREEVKGNSREGQRQSLVAS